MSKTLVIVESPTKARTISRFLGSDFVVESSYGHVRDLPSSKLGVDVEKDFVPQYVIPVKAKKNVKHLKEEAEKAGHIILATDEDREGEAIAWHLLYALGIEGDTKKKKKLDKKVNRIVFHEITKTAIDAALNSPREIDQHLVDAQQARRILDRLVGYKLSPFLWKKVYKGLSAGRVQSIAVKLIVEREREIQNFTPQEYWTITARVSPEGKEELAFDSELARFEEKAIDKFFLKNEADAKRVLLALKDASWIITKKETRAVSKNPSPPFTTSSLQQESFRKLGFSTKQTMVLAQQLYEGVTLAEGPVGLITYMRTDSVNLSNESLTRAREFLSESFGNAYLLPAPRKFITKTKGAQEAHEAIRPSDPFRTPESIKDSLDKRQYKLYDLIWRRFVASQMPQALFENTSVNISTGTDYEFHATGQTMKFDGFLKIYPTKFSENPLPELAQGNALSLHAITPAQHFTEPPARFNEASLVKILEQNGIGRPSTYAPTISTIQTRGYVERIEKRYLKPTETGILVNDLLVEHFPEIVDVTFTARMEESLDEIAEGKTKWEPVIREFYEPFAKHLAEKYEEVQKILPTETTDEICEKCGKPMAIKFGRFGKFLACTGFPDCKSTKALKSAPQTIDMKCPKCTEGDVIIRFTKRRKMFYGCSRYPQCDWASWTDPRIPKDASAEKEEKTEKENN